MRTASLLVVILSVIFMACRNKDAASGHIDRDLISFAEARDFVAEYDNSWTRKDTNALKQQMDSSYNYFSSTGSTLNRSSIISWFAPADKYKMDKAVRSEISVQLNGNTAIVSSRWKGHGSFDGQEFNDDQRCGLVLQKKQGKIFIISEHCTQITE